MQLAHTGRTAALALMVATVIVSSATGAGVTYTYDALGRITTAQYDNGVCIAYGYDANGNRTSQTNTVSGVPAMPTWGSGVLGCFQWQ
jgi:YD repeat-containing protein